MNKPVVISEEALVAPVAAPDVTSAVGTAGPAYVVLGGISFAHFLNDTMQSLIPSVYPILKDAYALDFAQIGLITLAFQFTASLLQPLVGHYTDKKPQPFSLSIGMGSTFFGLLLLSVAHQYSVILIAAASRSTMPMSNPPSTPAKNASTAMAACWFARPAPSR